MSWEIKQSLKDGKPWYIWREFTHKDVRYHQYLHSDGVARPGCIHDGYYKTKEEAEAVLTKGERANYLHTDVDEYRGDYEIVLSKEGKGAITIQALNEQGQPLVEIDLKGLLDWIDRHKDHIQDAFGLTL